ncbi:TraB/GumN family protein [Brevundimonas fluminis]|jgi:uncharacterized protein|uniref:TraB/GumN family protein n=1 Tax=Brevundimonas fluminis TaxID=2487274 RepID=UPI000F65648C|nr:TraB/GumN family protein [Brevundimonas fluminis]
MTRLPVLFASLVIYVATALAGPVRADPVVWRVTDDDTEMLLVGSLHALPDHIEWRTPALDAAVSEAELVVFEVLIPADPNEELALYAPYFQYFFAERPLDEIVSADVWARLEAALSEVGASADELKFLRPWAAAFMLDSLVGGDGGSDWTLGVDQVIETSLRPDQRTLALDTPELLHASFSAFADMADAEGEAMLVEALDMLEAEDAETSWEWEEAWAAGDLSMLIEDAEMMKAEAPHLYAAMMTARNEGWMPALIEVMATERRVVVVVGALHLVGPDGLPTLLRAAGYDVEGP